MGAAAAVCLVAAVAWAQDPPPDPSATAGSRRPDGVPLCPSATQPTAPEPMKNGEGTNGDTAKNGDAEEIEADLEWMREIEEFADVHEGVRLK